MKEGVLQSVSPALLRCLSAHGLERRQLLHCSRLPRDGERRPRMGTACSCGGDAVAGVASRGQTSAQMRLLSPPKASHLCSRSRTGSCNRSVPRNRPLAAAMHRPELPIQRHSTHTFRSSPARSRITKRSARAVASASPRYRCLNRSMRMANVFSSAVFMAPECGQHQLSTLIVNDSPGSPSTARFAGVDMSVPPATGIARSEAPASSSKSSALRCRIRSRSESVRIDAGVTISF